VAWVSRVAAIHPRVQRQNHDFRTWPLGSSDESLITRKRGNPKGSRRVGVDFSAKHEQFPGGSSRD
jgi:hypothetical protein